jgi:hypothetical protein
LPDASRKVSTIYTLASNTWKTEGVKPGRTVRARSWYAHDAKLAGSDSEWLEAAWRVSERYGWLRRFNRQGRFHGRLQ